MSDGITEPAEQKAGETPDDLAKVKLPDQSQKVEDVAARLAVLETERENAKKNEAGLQRKVQEQESLIETLRTENMSAKDRATYEAEQAQRQLDEQRIQLKNRETAMDKRDVMAELDIPAKFESRIFGNTKEELRADATAFMAIYNSDIDDTAKTRVNETLTTGKPPKSGEETMPVDGNLTDFQSGKAASEDEFLAYVAKHA